MNISEIGKEDERTGTLATVIRPAGVQLILSAAKQPFHFRVRVSTVPDSLANATVKLRLLRTTYCGAMARPIHKLLMRKHEDPLHSLLRGRSQFFIPCCVFHWCFR